MATLREILDALDTFLESSSGLNITCLKGYPDFRRGNITTPICAIFYGGSARADAGQIRQRVGASMTQTVITLGVYASNEINLFNLAESLQGLRDARPQLTAGSDSQPVRVYVGDDEREPPDEEAPKEMRHVIIAPLVLAFE